MRGLRILTLILIGALAGFSGSAAGATPAQAAASGASPAAGSAEDGREAFVDYGCYQCHGREGQGSSATGPRLAQRLLPQSKFETYVRDPTGVMPPYSTVILPLSDLRDIYEFLRTRPEPPPVESLPQLK